LLLALLPPLLLPAGLPPAFSCGPLLGPLLPGLVVEVTRIDAGEAPFLLCAAHKKTT
jgi:hypothetical protein